MIYIKKISNSNFLLSEILQDKNLEMIHSSVKDKNVNSILTIGSFDGLHLGHQYILDSFFQACKEINSLGIIITFSPHPKFITSKLKELNYLINTYDERNELIKDYLSKKEELSEVKSSNADFLILDLPFTKSFSELKAKDFVDEILIKSFKITKIIYGYDFAMGKDKSGNFDVMSSYYFHKEISIEKVNEKRYNDKLLSSSLLRELLDEGSLKEFTLYTGRHYFLKGNIVRGHQIGKENGIPTVNLNWDVIKKIPAKGVYATNVFYRMKSYNSITNIGFNPTVSNDFDIKIETYIFNFNENLYDQNITIQFIEKIRDEIKFDSKEELVSQIYKDIEKAKEIHTANLSFGKY